MGATVATDVSMPRLSDSMQEGTITRWLKSQGDLVNTGDAIVEIETDKALMAYEAEAGGLLEIVAPEGATAALGAVIARLLPPGSEVAGPEPTRGPAPTMADAPSPVAACGADVREPVARRMLATPIARRLAADLGLDLTAIRATGRRGQIMKADVQAHPRPVPSAEQSPDGAVAPAVAPPAGGVLQLSPVQRQIAQRMVESRATVPDFEISVDVDMAACVALRAELADQIESAPTLNDMVVRACALALQDHPRINGSYQGGGVALHSSINVGVAVAAADALLVVVVPETNKVPLAGLASRTRRLVERARSGQITPAEVSGGTFTVSNLGMFGVDRFTPIINCPQAAILAVGAIADRPVVRDGEVVPGKVMTATLASDHRIVYGADASRFLADIRRRLQTPLSLLI